MPDIIWKPARSENFGVGRTNHISRITFHHIVGDANAALDRFQNTSDQVSSHYVIGSDGTIYQCVRDTDTAYADGSWDSNSRSISIEHAGGLPNVPYTDSMYASSINLVRCLVSKYGISDFKRHREVIDTKAYPGGTACCGDLDVERIVNAALEEDMPTRTYIINSYLRDIGREPTDDEINTWLKNGWEEASNGIWDAPENGQRPGSAKWNIAYAENATKVIKEQNAIINQLQAAIADKREGDTKALVDKMQALLNEFSTNK